MRRSRIALHVAVVFAALVLGGRPPRAGEAQFVGHAKCRMCHMTEHKTWLATAHARALETLKPEDRGKAECLACHTTGAGKPAAAGADLAGVQCEACHGAGSLYKAPDVMSKSKYAADRAAAHQRAVAAGLATPVESTCTACHNAKSPTFKGFDFAAFKEKIKHWK